MVAGDDDITVSCCIAGCGPAGAMLGLLLARAGVDVLVLEKHGDFLRDFRGDTIHPSTLEILDELGLANRFLQLPHSEASRIAIKTTTGDEIGFSFERLPTRFRFIAFVPQWDFLDFVTREAARYPTFQLYRNAEVTDLVRESGAVRGIRYCTASGERTVSAWLTVGADGRSSRTREVAALPLVETSPPMDVLWFRLPRSPDEPHVVAGRVAAGAIVVQIDRGTYWQIASVIPKGTAERTKHAGLEAFRASVAAVLPELADRVDELRDWDQIKLLTVRSNRLLRWFAPGYLAIGDAAHAMTPVGGVGINVAIQDAVVAANLLWRPLRDRTLTMEDLAAVQEARERPVRIVQAAQAIVQRMLLKPALESTAPRHLSWLARLLPRVPVLRDVPPRLVAFGVGRPHVRSPALAPVNA